MFNKRKLQFHKKWIHNQNGGFDIITDAAITISILEFAQYYTLKIKKIKLSNIGECTVILNGDRDDFVCFVRKLLSKESKYLEQVKF